EEEGVEVKEAKVIEEVKEEFKPPVEETMTNEERHEAFRALLKETDVSPFTTWEKELPKIIHDPRYAYIKTLKEKKKLFDEYCRHRVAAIQKEKKSQQDDAKSLFSKLLDELSDYRTSWDEFARKHRKDPRLLNFSDDRVKKIMFNDHVAKLKEASTRKMREEKEAIEKAFEEMLEERKEKVGAKTSWMEVRREFEKDKRYQAVIASNDREVLFKRFQRNLHFGGAAEGTTATEGDEKERLRKEREAASMREREDAVRRQRMELSKEQRGTRNKLEWKDSETIYKAMLVDLVRTHEDSWSSKAPELERDPRWSQIRLSASERERLFNDHVSSIHERRLAAFHALVDETCDLVASFPDVQSLLERDPRSSRIVGASLDGDEATQRLRGLFERRQQGRLVKAKEELEAVLGESKFVAFHVKSAVQQAQVEAVEEKKLKEAPAGDEWRFINLEEIKQVMTQTKAYNDYASFPEERDRIVFKFVKALIETYRGEKGGTLDKTISKMAGGHTEDKFADRFVTGKPGFTK
ncbi:transcription elongation regulator, partial [Irineochytrium annulatum]